MFIRYAGNYNDVANNKCFALLNMISCIQDTSSNRLIDGLRNSVGTWLKDNSIKGFYSVTADENFAKGATSIMNLTGIGK